jgi:multicomponent Na+:H+ antiporter subunit F
MADFLVTSAGFVLAVVACGLVRVLHGPGRADRLMAAQLLGTGSIAALLLAATEAAALVDVAMVLGLLAAFASIAFVISGARSDAAEPGRSTHEHHA